MSEPIAIVHGPDDLHRACRARADAIQVSRETIDKLAGFTERYSAKVLSDPPVKGLSLDSLFALAPALGMAVALVENPEAMIQIAKRAEKRNESQVRARGAHKPFIFKFTLRQLKKMAAKGGKAYAQKVPQRKRSQLARRAAKARWAMERERQGALRT